MKIYSFKGPEPAHSFEFNPIRPHKHDTDGSILKDDSKDIGPDIIGRVFNDAIVYGYAMVYENNKTK